MIAYNIAPKDNGHFGLQRIGSREVHGDFATFVEALEAATAANNADATAKADPEQY